MRNVSSLKLERIKKKVDDARDLSLLKSKHFIKKDKILLLKNLRINERKISRIIKDDLDLIQEKIKKAERSKEDIQKFAKVIDSALFELEEKFNLLKSQVKIIRKIQERILKKKEVISKKLFDSKEIIQEEKGKKEFLKESLEKVRK